MEQILSVFFPLNNQNQGMRREEKVAALNVFIMASGASVIGKIYCEEDSPGDSIHRNEPDWDEMTDFGFWNYRKQRQHRGSLYPGLGYGDDD